MHALDGIKVLDLGTFIAGPFCATVLGEFGAEIIKIERPGVGDHLRRFGTETECGDTLVWLSEARNKRSVTLDLTDPRGQQILRELIADADIVIENFRPGVMERFGFGFDEIHAINPRTVMLRVSAYGQSGPNRDLPGFARVAHAFSGLAYLAGEPDGPPVTPGSTSLADYMTGLYGVIGVLTALQARERTGRGQVVDLALYETIFRALDELAPAFQQFGFVRERMGADTVNVTPHSHYQAADGGWVAIACSHDDMFVRLAKAMGDPDLASPDLFGPKAARLKARDEVNALVSGWVGSLSRDEVIKRCVDAEVPAGPLYSIADIVDDPQYLHRGTITTTESRIGPLSVPNVIPALSDTPGEIRWLGRELGSDTDSVLQELLARTPSEIATLRADGVI
ncbi:crotonobetainyl-CoA:carnitine CoA-transferase CaiB-like acyl-CoA transferase [Rhodococcus sp. SMB37]|uniref:CaiB/BaiF CoA transferase family protein n=1 Tax=Rhodococcus sp. SMB37 TaxID=2512213 RepID=UPI00104D7A81|nr:CoA transferase [Rhodococcus sp. SMB37]TCN55967.1 crotonobetainyl-CoA:carnitine CoA-transferase CaiB-like acyl-CoA transferase [Rhodococcus sp. SMB37]